MGEHQIEWGSGPVLAGSPAPLDYQLCRGEDDVLAAAEAFFDALDAGNVDFSTYVDPTTLLPENGK